MIYQDKEVKLKDGRSAVLRNARVEDSADLIKYLKTTAIETPYLINELEEITLTLEEEEKFIKGIMESENKLMLIATIDGKHVGNCSMMSVGNKQRFRHRCTIGIVLFQEYWGIGLGKQMLLAVLEQAKAYGYEQAELEVMTGNYKAISLYMSLGFEVCGTLKNNMKYKDGTYADAYSMIKFL